LVWETRLREMVLASEAGTAVTAGRVSGRKGRRQPA
jgi:hypothetical protein